MNPIVKTNNNRDGLSHAGANALARQITEFLEAARLRRNHLLERRHVH